MELSTSSVAVVMLLMLSAFVHHGSPHKSERTVPGIVPSKLQLFEYTTLTVNCEGFFSDPTQWRVVRNVGGNVLLCNKNTEGFGLCHIPMAYTEDSGEYWCESKDQRWRSQGVQVTVTEGDVVLESPVRPVMVGDNVTLRCIEKKSKNPSTEFFFYKDGVKVNSSSVGEMTIHNISESDQGKYKCSTSDNEFSGENQLEVRAVLLQSPDRPVIEGTNVTLFCRDKMAAPNHTSVFYKDGQIVMESSSGELTLNVSKSDEGVYKCRSSEGRESEEQWLAVRGEDLHTGNGRVDATDPERSIVIGRDDLITVIVSVVIGLGVLPLLLTFLILNKVDVSDESVKQTVIFQVTKIRDDEKREHSRVSRRGRGSAQVDTK